MVASSRRRNFLLAILFQLMLLVPLATPAARAGLSLPLFSKSFSSSTIGPGSVSTLTFTIQNLTGSPVTGLDFSDTLPAGVTIATPANASTGCFGGTLTAPDGGSTISYTGGGLANNGTCTVQVDVTSSVPGTHSNVSGSLTSSAGNSGTASANLTVAADRPGISKSFAASSIELGDVTTLTFTIDNSANANMVLMFNATDLLPGGLRVANPTNASTTCAAAVTATAGASSIFFSGGGLAAGATCTVSVDVVGVAAGSWVNVTSDLNSSSGTAGKATAAIDVVFAPRLLTKTFVDDPVAPGGTVTLEFTLINFDRFDDATNIAFTDDLNTTLSGLVATGLPLANPCGTGSQLSGTSLLSFTGGNLPPEGSCTFSVTLSVPAGATAGTYPNVTSVVTTTVGGSGVMEPAAMDNLVVSPVPLLTKSFTDDPVVAGNTVTLEFTITNTSATDAATGITFLDDLTAVVPGLLSTGLPQSNVCGAGSTLSQVANVPVSGDFSLMLSGGNLAAGASCTFSVTLNVPAGAPPGSYPNATSTISATVNGSVATGNPATDDLVVLAAPSLSKDFTNSPVAPGGIATLAFTLSFDENAPAGATNIAFTDDLSAALAGLTAIGLPQMDVCGTGSQISGTTNLSFTGGSLNAGESCTFTVMVQVPAAAPAGTFTNTTSTVTATELGEAVTGSPATAQLEVAALVLGKEFTDDPVFPGDTVTLEFTITNASTVSAASGLAFTDNLTTALSGLTALGLPLMDVCGAGSQISGTTTLTFTGGNLAAGASCTFSVTLQIPAGTTPGQYTNITGTLMGDLGGTAVTVPAAQDDLSIFTPLAITKTFTDDPAIPGSTVTLEFTLSNLDPAQSATGLTFTDDLSAALSGLVATGLPASNVCGAGSQISGTSLLTFTGGTLAAASSCTFSVTLQVPPGVSAGTVATNTTSSLTGTVGGVAATGDPATDTLQIRALNFSKAFAGVGFPGVNMTLSFTIENLDSTNGVTGLAFSDNLSAVLSGLAATGLPATDVCGAGSVLSGTSTITLSNGSLAASGSCTINVTVQVPMAAVPGSYLNTSSTLLVNGLAGANPATDTLGIELPPTFAKSFAPGVIPVGGTSTLTFTIDNTASTVAASNLAFTDNLPTGVQVAAVPNAASTCGGTVTAMAASGLISLSGGTAGAGASCTVQVDVTATMAGTHVNTTGNLTSTSGSSGTASDTLIGELPPAFAKAFAPDVILLGNVSTLTFTIDNSANTLTAAGLTFTDNLPAGVQVAATPNAANTCGGTVTAAAGSGVISFSGGSVTGGSTCTVQADVTGTASGSHVNTTGDLTSSSGSSGTAMATLTVVEGVLLEKAFLASPVLPGGTVDLEFTITNASAVAVTGLTFTDDLNAALAGLTAVGLPVSNVCGAGSQLAGTTLITLTGGSLAASTQCTFVVSVQVPAAAAAGSYVNTTSDISGTSAGAPVVSPPATAGFDVAFLGFSKAFGVTTVTAGSVVTLTFTVTNPDPVNTATGITFTDDLDAFVPGAVATDVPQTDICGMGSDLSGASLLTLANGTLAPSATCVFSVQVEIPATAQAGMVTNQTSVLGATVGGSQVTGDPADVATATLTIGANALAIPTLGSWGLLLLSGLLAFAALFLLRKQGQLRRG